MKKLLLIPFILAIIFVAGCNRNVPEAANTIPTTVIATTIAERSPIQEVSGFGTEKCPTQFLRKQIKADGSIEEYCLSPDYFRLKPCQTDTDCEDVEICTDGYCSIVDEDIIA